MVLEKLDSYTQKNETGPSLTPYKNVNSKWIKDLNVRPETIKLLKENIVVSTLTPLLAMIFFVSDFKTKATKAKINKWEHIKLRDFLKTKKIINKMKRQPTE